LLPEVVYSLRILFWRLQIQKQLLPAKSMSDLVVYYYNVWKTRGTPRARAWWHAVEEVWRVPVYSCRLSRIMLGASDLRFIESPPAS